MISLTIDGQRLEVVEGTTLLDACRQLSINIPTLCYYQAIEPYGGCRLCLVEVRQGGRTRLTTACTAPAEEGLEVITSSNRITKARQMTMELLLARCSEVPEIQQMALQLGLQDTRFKKRLTPVSSVASASVSARNSWAWGPSAWSTAVRKN